MKFVNWLLVFILYLKVKLLHHQTDVDGEIMTKRNVFLLWIGELDSGHCNSLLPVEEKQRSGTSDKVFFLDIPKNFL
jgi:hypothetical protein